MDQNLKYTPFYILIVARVIQDHEVLTSALHRNFPQAIIESIYEEGEAVSYFSKGNNYPQMIFLDMNMQSIFVKLALYMVREKELMRSIPIAMINSKEGLSFMKELQHLGANEFYKDVFKKLELPLITHDILKKWLKHGIN